MNVNIGAPNSDDMQDGMNEVYISFCDGNGWVLSLIEKYTCPEYGSIFLYGYFIQSNDEEFDVYSVKKWAHSVGPLESADL